MSPSWHHRALRGTALRVQLGVHLGAWVKIEFTLIHFVLAENYFSPQVHPPSVGWMVGPFGLMSYSRRYTLKERVASVRSTDSTRPWVLRTRSPPEAAVG